MKKRWVFITLSLFLVSLVPACGNMTTSREDSSERQQAPWELVEEGEEPVSTGNNYASNEETHESADVDGASLDHLFAPADSTAAAYDTVPKPNLSKYRSIGSLEIAFNDSNKYQYAAGERIGIRPIQGIADAYYLRRPLVKVQSNDNYTVEHLTHSMPYLVPEAASLLETIGRNFRDSLKRKNLGDHRIRVTSLLRSAHSVKSLRKVNTNATDSSTHQLGTTFDLSYSVFDFTGGSRRGSEEELKYVLAEVLRDLRNQRKCLVKYEKKSPCFHITATGR